MRLLLDTEAVIWWPAGDQALSRRAREAIADEANSVASAMEVATKFRLGKLPGATLLAKDFEASSPLGDSTSWRSAFVTRGGRAS